MLAPLEALRVLREIPDFLVPQPLGEGFQCVEDQAGNGFERMRPMRFVIIDEKELAMMLMDDKTDPTYDIGVWVNSPFFAKALESLYETVWSKAKVKVKV